MSASFDVSSLEGFLKAARRVSLEFQEAEIRKLRAVMRDGGSRGIAVGARAGSSQSQHHPLSWSNSEYMACMPIHSTKCYG